MKTLYLLLVILAVIISLDFELQPAHADNTNGISIQNIAVHSSTVKVGDAFTVTATLVNNSTVPIVLDGGKCSIQDTQASFFTMMFDNHTKIKSKNLTCAGVGWSQILNPGKNIIGTSPDSTLFYIATESGTANVTVTFRYSVKNQTDPAQPNIEQTISKSLLFTIYDNDTIGKSLKLGNHPVTNKISSPLKQLRQGTKAEDIVCQSNFVLIINHKTAHIACVRSLTLDRLVSVGWTEVRSDPKLLHMNVSISGSYIPLTLQDHFLRGSLKSQIGPLSNVTVSIFANGVPMGTTRTFPDGCFQFNNWDEKKFSPKIDEYVNQDRMQVEHLPKYILFSARYMGDENHYPASAQASSYLYLYSPPIAPAMYVTEPQSLVENLTQGDTIQFQLGIKPILKQSEIENPNLVLQSIPCGLDYDVKPIGDKMITQNNEGKFIITLKAASYVTPGKYFVKISNNLSQSGYPEQYFDEISSFVLNVMKS